MIYHQCLKKLPPCYPREDYKIHIPSIKGVIEKVTNFRKGQIKELLAMPNLFYENERYLRSQDFYSFREFKESTKYKSGWLSGKFEPDLKGYLEYLKSHVPKLYEYLTGYIEAKIPRREFKSHMYVTGKTKSGKSELLNDLIRDLLLEKTCYAYAPHLFWCSQVRTYQ